MISLSCAISEYDHIRDLQLGSVVPVGLSLNFVNLPVEEVFYRSIRFQEFDVSEMSMGRFVAMMSSDVCPFVAIPVFPSRSFRHSAIYVRTDSGINSPRDMRGRRVGIPEWAQTAGIYVRGLLSDDYGVAAKDIEWVQGGLQQAGREEEVALSLSADIRIRSEKERTLNALLLAGELDAIISAHPPEAVKRADSRVRRLFDATGDVERSYWKSTGIFPIMHAIVVRKEVFDHNRWIAMNLYRAFDEAKNRCLARAREATASRYPFPLMNNYIQKAAEMFGEDLWPYGIEANRKTLDSFLRYAHEQGVSKRLLKISDLFPAEIGSQYKI